jgi:FMN phosphatase YigB (HAD superfamily)
MEIRAFIFDVGRVLIDYDLDALASKMAAESPELRRRVHNLRVDPSLREVESGRISGEAYFRDVIKPLAPQWTYRDLVNAWKDAFTINAEGKRLYDDVRRMGYPAYLLSNLASFNREAIDEKFPGFLSDSRGCFCSYELGFIKPQPEIYLTVCERIGVPPFQCLFLDDTEECVEGARRVGMGAVLFSESRIGEVRREMSALTGVKFE